MAKTGKAAAGRPTERMANPGQSESSSTREANFKNKMNIGPSSHQLQARAFAVLDRDGDGVLSPTDLHQFMATTPLAERFSIKTCNFMHSWLREQTSQGRTDFVAVVGVTEVSYQALGAASAKVKTTGQRGVARQLSRIHSKALEHDTIEDLFAKYFVTGRFGVR